MKTKLMNMLYPALALMLAGCAKEPVVEPAPDDAGRIPLNIDGAINQVQTKVSNAGFVDKDALGLFAVNYTDENTAAGALMDSGNQADNAKYIYDESANKWTPVKSVYYKDVNTHVDLYLYYPYQSTVTEVNASNFEVQKDQSAAATAASLSGYEASDFLWGKATDIAPTEAKIPVKLTHRLSAVNVMLKDNGGFAEGEFASLGKSVIITNTTRKATINYSTGEVSALGNPQQDGIVMCPQEEGSFRAVVIPQTVEAGTQLFSITIDGVPYAFRNSDAATAYQAGKQLDVTVNIRKRNPSGDYELTLGGVNIIDWTEDRNTHSGEARQYYVVNLTEAGTLEQTIKDAGKNPAKIRNLKVTGPVTTEDFYFMRDKMDILEAVNMKEAKVVNAECNDVVWSESIKKDDVIPYKAFYQKKTLTHFSFPEKISYIGDYAFSETSLRGALIIPDDVTEIGDYAFIYSLTSNIVFPANLAKIGDAAFLNCSSLSGTLMLPETVTSIGSRAFSGCSFTGELHLPNNLENIGDQAFNASGNFVGGLKIPDKIQKLHGNTFMNSGFTGELDLNNVIELNREEFYYCNFNGVLSIPEGIIEIPDGCFQQGKFSKVIVSKSVKRIAQFAFCDLVLCNT